ncbi:MAG: peptide chain release factor 3, partial [Planctomycetota bacterium]
ALTPVFFGSAMRSFGVELLLDALVELAPPPGPRLAGDRLIEPTDASFSGFIFKIQANMDPRHRDRLAFVRICSGRFERDMQVIHTRTGERVRLASSQRVFGRERETVDIAYPGDVVGLMGRAGYRIGDTLAEDATLSLDGIPTFAPECFAYLHGEGSAEQKRFSKGLDQLLQEGVVQSFLVDGAAQRIPLLGAVGPLQFEVVQYRLKSEYGAGSRLEHAKWSTMCWVIGDEPIDEREIPSGARLCRDGHNRPVILFTDGWSRDYFARGENAKRLSDIPPAVDTQ